jgi:hypothetical protein
MMAPVFFDNPHFPYDPRLACARSKTAVRCYCAKIVGEPKGKPRLVPLGLSDERRDPLNRHFTSVHSAIVLSPGSEVAGNTLQKVNDFGKAAQAIDSARFTQ